MAPKDFPSSAVEGQTRSRLLDLPLEIRHTVFTLYFGTWNGTVTVRETSYNGDVQDLYKVQGVPSLNPLYVSRQIYSEVKDIPKESFSGRLITAEAFARRSPGRLCNLPSWLHRRVEVVDLVYGGVGFWTAHWMWPNLKEIDLRTGSKARFEIGGSHVHTEGDRTQFEDLVHKYILQPEFLQTQGIEGLRGFLRKQGFLYPEVSTNIVVELVCRFVRGQNLVKVSLYQLSNLVTC